MKRKILIILFILFTIFIIVEISYIWEALVEKDSFALVVLPTALAFTGVYIILLLLLVIRKLKRKQHASKE